MNQTKQRTTPTGTGEPASSSSQLLRLGEFGRLVGLAGPTVRKWIASRRIASVKLSSRAVRIPASEVERLIRERLQPAVLSDDPGK